MNNRELISKSVDAYVYKSSLKIYLIGLSFLILFTSFISIILFWDLPKELPKALIGYNVIFIVGHAPAILYTSINFVQLLKRSDTYIFSEAILSEYHSKRRRFYFRATITDENGKKYTGDTISVFCARSGMINLEKWLNQKALVAYDPKRERIIIVGLSKNFRHITEANQPTNQTPSY